MRQNLERRVSAVAMVLLHPRDASSLFPVKAIVNSSDGWTCKSVHMMETGRLRPPISRSIASASPDYDVDTWPYVVGLAPGHYRVGRCRRDRTVADCQRRLRIRNWADCLKSVLNGYWDFVDVIRAYSLYVNESTIEPICESWTLTF